MCKQESISAAVEAKEQFESEEHLCKKTIVEYLLLLTWISV